MDTKDKFSWWTKRTKIEKCSLVIIAVCFLLILYLASNLFMKFPSNDEGKIGNICMTEKCIRTAAGILNMLNRKIDPCEDFYKFTCGNFIKNTIIPDEKTSVLPFSEVYDQIQMQFKEIIEEPITVTDPKYVKLVKTVYKSCMNTTRIETESVDYFKRAFKDLGGWPVLEVGYWNEKNFDWKKLIYRLRKIGWRYNMFLSLYIGRDMRNSSRRMVTINQPCMNYETLKKGLNDTNVRATYNYLIDLATLFGVDRLHATAEMREVIEFEISLAKIMIPYKDRKNATLEYNPIHIRQLQREFPSIPWQQFINVYLSPTDMLTSEDVVNVALPKFLEDLEDLLSKTKHRTLANYMFSRIVRDSVFHLPESFRTKQLDYLKILYGITQTRPRWKECIGETTRLSIAMSSLYVQHFFNKASKRAVTELVLDVKSAFIENLRKNGWMDRKTKKHALLKAEKMSSFVAYPDELLDHGRIEEYYEGLEVNPDEFYLLTAFNMSLFDHVKQVKTLRETVVKSDWKLRGSYAFVVNAFYDQNENAIELPAGILRDNFFDPDRPQYMNYGSIGAIIGHEITHGFDDHGRQYNEDGNLVDWWDPETNTTFFRKSQCLVEQYGNYTIPEIGMNVNGVNNLGENIADNGGVKMAYRGYLKWLERNKPELGLPGLKYSPRQMFWIATAGTWCTKYKKEALKQMVTSGYHAPSYFRAMVPLMNSDHFGRDFNCPLGSPMNPKYKCRVW